MKSVALLWWVCTTLQESRQWAATLPSEWGSNGGMPSLQSCKLQGGWLNGSLPETWGRQLKNLTNLELSSNFLTGGLLN